MKRLLAGLAGQGSTSTLPVHAGEPWQWAEVGAWAVPCWEPLGATRSQIPPHGVAAPSCSPHQLEVPVLEKCSGMAQPCFASLWRQGPIHLFLGLIS